MQTVSAAPSSTHIDRLRLRQGLADCMGCIHGVPVDAECTCREHGDATCTACRSLGAPEHTCQESNR